MRRIVIEIIATQTYATSTQISWTTLPEYYIYEVGIVGSGANCSSMYPSTLPQGYTSYANTTGRSIEVTGLEPSTCYLFGVRAHSTRTGNPGEWTVICSITQPFGEFHPKHKTDSLFPHIGPPGSAPLLHIPVTINTTAVSLSWDEVSCTDRNGVITGYIVQYTITGGMTVTVNISATTSVVIAGLINFRLYSFSVAAINDNGIGPYSNEKQFYSGLHLIYVLILIGC